MEIEYLYIDPSIIKAIVYGAIFCIVFGLCGLYDRDKSEKKGKK